MDIDEKQVLEIAKKIKFYNSQKETFWEQQSKITLEDIENDFYGYGDYEDQLSMKENLLKVVRKCIMDDFPILEYYLFDMECEMTFINIIDYEKYLKDKSSKNIRAISFLCIKEEQIATPISLDGNKMYKNCFEALEV